MNQEVESFEEWRVRTAAPPVSLFLRLGVYLGLGIAAAWFGHERLLLLLVPLLVAWSVTDYVMTRRRRAADPRGEG